MACKEKVVEQATGVTAYRKKQVQALYLTIQAAYGELIDMGPPEVRKKLKWQSTELCRVKREWIGTFDEIDASIEENGG